MSDCHRGVGNYGDNFLQNQNVFFAALSYYYERNFTYIELGDGDELWENRNLQLIIKVHSDAFWNMSRFFKQGRMMQLFGNHDMVKKNARYFQGQCDNYYCESQKCDCDLFKGMQVYEGIVLKDAATENEILLVHGHQGDLLNDRLWRVSRFLVRYLWRPLELIGMYQPVSIWENEKRWNKIEKKLEEWSRKENKILIAGHTHRPVFAKPGKTMYFNDGSCVHPRCITAIEIENGFIMLVKWSIMVKVGRILSVEREVLEGPVPLQTFWNLPKEL